MANLEYVTLQSLEDLFELRNGYILDFTNNSFQRFVKGIVGIDIYEDEGYEEYCSKANKLRQIFDTESLSKVTKLINALLSYYEDYKLKDNNLTDYDRKKVAELKITVQKLEKKSNEDIFVMEELDEIIRNISTRQVGINEMSVDERLKEIGNLLEYLLKKNGKFITLNYEDISLGFVNEDDVRQLRKKVQCFRHSTEESIQERKEFRKNQKQFLIEYGMAISTLVYNELKITE